MIARKAWSTCTLLCSLSLLVACQNPRDELIGEWVVDESAFAQEQSKLELIPPAVGLVEELSAPLSMWRLDFKKTREFEALIDGERLRGRYQINRSVSNTVYIRAEVKPVYQSDLDTALKLTPPTSKVQTRRLSMRISGDRASLTYHDMKPLKMRRSGM